MSRRFVRPATIAAAAVALAVARPAPAASQDATTHPGLDLSTAKELATAARRYAGERAWQVVVAIVDAGGHLVLLERMDGAQLGSVEVAREKARTAVLFRRPTHEIQDWVDNGNLAILNLTGAIPLAGGRPLRVDGQIVGAIGISGMTAAQDDEVARTALERRGDPRPSSDATRR